MKENNKKIMKRFGYTGWKLRTVLILAFALIWFFSMLLATWVDQLAKRGDYSENISRMQGDILEQLDYDLAFLRENPEFTEQEQEERRSSSLYAALSSRAQTYSTRYQQVSAAVYDENGRLAAQSTDILSADMRYGSWVLGKSFLLADHLTEEELITLAQYEAENTKAHDYGRDRYEFSAGYTEDGKELTAVQARRVYYSTDDREQGKMEGEDADIVIWQNEDVSGTEKTTEAVLWMPGIACGGISAWENWRNQAYLQEFPEEYKGTDSGTEEKDFVLYMESAAGFYPDNRYDEPGYTLVIRSAAHPWMAAVDSLKVIYAWGAALSALCAGLVLFIVERTFRRRALLEEQRRDFINAIAHEMKTPLAVIRGFSENLEENANSGKRKYYLEQIIGQTERMDDMVKEMVCISGLDSGAYRLKKEKISVRDLIGELAAEQNDRIEEKRIDLQVSCKEDFVIEGDKRFIEKAFVCILDNAVSHNREEGTILIHMEKDRCVIENTGERIPEEDLPRVCELFFTGEKSRDRGEKHLGAGLYLAERIFRMHGLKLKIENTESGVRAVVVM